MSRSLFGLTSLWGGLTVLTFCGTASAQWFPGSSGGCNCSSASMMGPPPIMHQSAAYGAAPMMPASYAMSDAVQCGPPVCQMVQPAPVVHVQACAPVATVVAVQPMQPVHHAVMADVRVVEHQPVKRTVSRPVVTTEYVDQTVTEMRPVSELKTVNVPTVDYQTVTENRTITKQVGYWATKNVPTGRVNAWQYDNRPNTAGYINRSAYNLRNAFTPAYVQQRTFVPQTMTCTVPYCKKVAIPGMKQVTYNITRMQPTQTVRKVAVNKVTYQTAEVTVLQPVQTVKTMQVGTHVSYQPLGNTAVSSNPNAPQSALAPTPDANNKAAAPRNANAKDGMDPNNINRGRTSGALETNDPYGQRVGDITEPVNTFSAPSVVRVSQWVARTPSSSSPQPGGKSAAISIADSTR